MTAVDMSPADLAAQRCDLLLKDMADWSEHIAKRLRDLAEYGNDSTAVFDEDLSTLVLLMAQQVRRGVESLAKDMLEAEGLLAEQLEHVKRYYA